MVNRASDKDARPERPSGAEGPLFASHKDARRTGPDESSPPCTIRVIMSFSGQRFRPDFAQVSVGAHRFAVQQE